MKQYVGIPDLLNDIDRTNDVLQQIDPSERVRYLMIVDNKNGTEITDFEYLVIFKNGDKITLKQPVLISCNQNTYLYTGDEQMDYDSCFAIEDVQRIILVHNVSGIEIQYDFEFHIWNYSFLN